MKISLTFILVSLLLLQTVEKSQSALPGDILGGSSDNPSQPSSGGGSQPTSAADPPAQTTDQPQPSSQQPSTPSQTASQQQPTTAPQTTENATPAPTPSSNNPTPSDSPATSDGGQQTPSSSDDSQPARTNNRHTRTAQQTGETPTGTDSPQSSPSSDSSQDSTNSGSNNTATIAGSVVGGLVGIALIAGFVTWLNRRGGCTSRTNRRNNDYEKQTENVFFNDGDGGEYGTDKSKQGTQNQAFHRPLVPPTFNDRTLRSDGTGSPPPQNLEMYGNSGHYTQDYYQPEVPMNTLGRGYQKIGNDSSLEQPQYYTSYTPKPEENLSDQKPDTVDYKPHQV